jgi:ABC-type hemin transport system substrate-binding protein
MVDPKPEGGPILTLTLVAARHVRPISAKFACYSGVKAWMFLPSRIVCLTEETVETFYLLGEQDRIVGISRYVAMSCARRRRAVKSRG